MIFSVIIIVAVVGVTYMHYLQGVFTAAISLACAVAATLVAFGYYENAIGAMTQNGFADYAGGMTLIMIFTATYVVLRVAADSLVPGNLTLQLYVERVGAAVLGFAAAVLGAGVFAVGAQMMPLGPAVAGYARYELREREVNVPAAVIGRTRASDSSVYNEVAGDKFENPSGLLLPADGFALGLAKIASAGAFAGRQSFGDIHPDLPAEAFYDRIGPEQSGKHVILNTTKQQNAKVEGVYTLGGSVTALDTEIVDIRDKKVSQTYKPSNADNLLVIRVAFNDPAADKDSIVRLTAAASRLSIDGQQYFPIGTMEGSAILALNRLDDLIPVASTATRSVDLVYNLPKSAMDALAKATPDGETIAFVEFKLFGRVDLAGMKVDPFGNAPRTTKVVRKASSPLGAAAKVGAKAPQ